MRIMVNENIEVGYQFTAVPVNLYLCCDINVRSMLFTLVQLSSYYADNDGWFFRTNEDLRAESQLSENLVRATISTLYRLAIIDVQTVGKGKSKTPNKFRLNVDLFKDWEKYSIEDCTKHPDLRIETENYKVKDWQPSYLKKLDSDSDSNATDKPIPQPKLSQSEDYIYNIENENNKENILSVDSKPIEVKSSPFEEYKKREDFLMNKLYSVTSWTDFTLYRKLIIQLLSTAQTPKIAEKTRMRYKKIEDGKIRYFKSIISKEPYNSFYDDFYKEYNCGWLGKESTTSRQNIDQPQSVKSIEAKESTQTITNPERLSKANEFNPSKVLRDIQTTTASNFTEEDEDYDLPF